VQTSRTPYLILFLAKLQRWARRSGKRVQAVRSIRNIIHFGPWRYVLLARARRAFAPAESVPGASVLVPGLDVDAAVSALEAKGDSTACRFRPEVVSQLKRLLPSLHDGVHVDAHRRHAVLGEIISAPDVLRVVRHYFLCEPVLLECKVFVGVVPHGDPLSSGFHFDHAGPRSLNLMAYLTDVDDDTAPHVLIEGTQTGKKLRDFFRERLSVDEAEQRFPGRIKTITGPAGTMFFENTEIFHMRRAGRKRRALLNVVYSTRGKRLLSLGRTEALI
jgi:hypothetical protein